MPKIIEYDAPLSETKISPDSTGYSAAETAGRRIGPLFQQQAADVEKGGRLSATMLEQDKLPLEFDRFRRDTQDLIAPPKAGGFKVVGNINGEGGGSGGRGAGVAHGQMARGAQLLSGLANRAVSSRAPGGSRGQGVERGQGQGSRGGQMPPGYGADVGPDGLGGDGGYINYDPKKNALIAEQAEIAKEANSWPGMTDDQRAAEQAKHGFSPNEQPASYDASGNYTPAGGSNYGSNPQGYTDAGNVQGAVPTGGGSAVGQFFQDVAGSWAGGSGTEGGF